MNDQGVIISTYNRAHLIGRSNQNVLNQTYYDNVDALAERLEFLICHSEVWEQIRREKGKKGAFLFFLAKILSL